MHELIRHGVGTATIRRADAHCLPLEDESVDLIVTSPPYFALRSYTDGGEHYDGQIGSEATPQAFLEALWAVTAECKRVLKPSGSMWVNLGDKYSGGQPHSDHGTGASSLNGHGGAGTAKDNAGKFRRDPVSFGSTRPKSLMGLPWRYAIGCIDNLGLILRAEVVWSKPNGLPESVTDRVRRSHEQWFHFTKEPRYFAAVDEVREPHVRPDDAPRPLGTRNMTPRHADATDNTGWKDHGVSANPLGKLPGSVWTIPSEPLKVPAHIGVDHFAAFPQEWPRRIILGWSPSGICLECGEGRRPVVAKELEHVNHTTNAKSRRGNEIHPATKTRNGKGATNVSRETATITGYACACPTPDAPTRPAVVLDPFGGTGTVAMVARALGRYGISFDLSSDYLRLARWRVWKSGHEYKTHAREWAEANDAIVDGKVKVPAKVKREIEAEMLERQVAGRRLERDAWSAVCRG